MDAIGVRTGAKKPSLLEIPQPEPAQGEALVRTLRIGVDGTDHEVIEGTHGSTPEGDDYLILGHEAVGVIEQPNGTQFERGDVVVPTVRRAPPAGSNEYFDRGEADMAPPDQTVERGIDGAHGFASEYFTSPEEYLISIPASLARYGALVEPVSVSEKAIELANASRSSFDWNPETALVLGNGSLGLLTVAMLADEYEVYCLGRRDRPDPTIEVIETLGATYVDSRQTPVSDIPDTYEPIDLLYEATGHAKHALDSVHALAPNGVAALLGLPDSWTFEVDGGQFHKELVLTNKALIGSVNSAPRHFEAAAEQLHQIAPDTLDAIQTDVVGIDSFQHAFSDDVEIKAAIEFSTLDDVDAA